MRARLQAAGKDLFSRFGLAKTTVREICAAASVPTGSFYLFYPSKDELYAEILVAAVAEQRERNSASLPLGPNTEDVRDRERTLRLFLTRMIDDLERDPILAQFYRRDSRDSAKRALISARGGAAYSEISSGLDSLISGWIGEGLVGGEASSVRKIVQALIFLSVNRAEIAGGADSALIDSYVEFVAAGLARGKKEQP